MSLLRRLWRKREKRAQLTEQQSDDVLPVAFDADYYLQGNQDIRDAGMDPWVHYTQFGWEERRAPHPDFDTAWYLDQNPDVAVSGVNPFLHFVHYGWREGRQPREGMTCDPESLLGFESKPEAFNPFDHLIDDAADWSDWSHVVRRVATESPEKALHLCELWEQTTGDKNDTITLLRVESYSLLGRYDEACQLLEGFVHNQEANLSSLVEYAVSLIRVGQLDKLAAVRKRIIAVSPCFYDLSHDEPQHQVLLAFDYLENDKALNAVALCDRLVDHYAGHTAALLCRGLALRQLGSRDEALDDLLTAVCNEPFLVQIDFWLETLSELMEGNVEASWFNGIEKILAKRDVDAMEDTVATLSESEVTRKRLLAHLYATRGDCHDALVLLGGIEESGENVMSVKAFVRRLKTETDHPEEREQGWLALVREDSLRPYVNFRYLECWDKTHHGCARPAYMPADVHLCLLLAAGLSCAGRNLAAAVCLETAIQSGLRQNNIAEAHSALALCRLHLGQYDLAEAAAKHALTLDALNADAARVCGVVSRQFKRLEEAVGYYRIAVTAAPQPSWVYVNMAEQLDKSGQRKDALRVINEGLDWHPENSSLKHEALRLDWLIELQALCNRIDEARLQAADTANDEARFLDLIHCFIDADWPIIGRDLAECRLFLDRIMRKGENAALHDAYGDLLVRCGGKFDAIGYYDAVHHIAAAKEDYVHVRAVMRKIIAALEQLELYERCLSYLEQYVHGLDPAECREEYRRLACYNLMCGNTEKGREFWRILLQHS